MGSVREIPTFRPIKSETLNVVANVVHVGQTVRKYSQWAKAFMINFIFQMQVWISPFPANYSPGYVTYLQMRRANIYPNTRIPRHHDGGIDAYHPRSCALWVNNKPVLAVHPRRPADDNSKVRPLQLTLLDIRPIVIPWPGMLTACLSVDSVWPGTSSYNPSVCYRSFRGYYFWFLHSSNACAFDHGSFYFAQNQKWVKSTSHSSR